MGKSYKKNNKFDKNIRNESSSYKRRRDQVKEDHIHDDLSEYKIHGFKRNKD